MPGRASPAPRGACKLVGTIMGAITEIPEMHRKAAFKHAAAAVREQLIAQAERAKLASWKAPVVPGAKRIAAVGVIREAAAAEASVRTSRRSAEPPRRSPAGRAGGSALPAPTSRKP